MKFNFGITTIIVVLLLAVATAASLAAPPTQPQVGNGYIATFVNTSNGIFVGGVFDGTRDKSTRAALPFRHIYFLPNEASPIPNPDPSIKSNFELDMKVAMASANFNITSSPTQAKASQTWFAHRVHRHLFVQEVSLQNLKKNNNVSVGLRVEEDSADTAHLRVINQSSHPGVGDVTVYQTLNAEVPGVTHPTTICVLRQKVPSSVSTSTTAKLHFFTIFVTSLANDAWATRKNASQTIVDVAVELFQKYASVKFETLYQEHVDAWLNGMWKSRLEYTAPRSSSNNNLTRLAKTIEASQYALLISLRSDWPFSTSPGGLTTDGYNGHTFWDFETWMFPFLMFFQPDISRENGIAYRLNREQGAEVNAKQTVGVQFGAAFPWESAFSGYDVCPWPQGEHTEIHITADVVLAWRQFFFLHFFTQQKKKKQGQAATTFLKSIWPLLKKTADFWIARATVSRSPPRYSSSQHNHVEQQVHIDNVTSPDEYHMGNDSVYTNFAAKLAVEFALDVATMLDETSSVQHLQGWRVFVRDIVLLYDKEKDYHPEFAGYKGDQVKQADVVLLNYPLAMRMPTNNTARNDLVYYESRTNPGGPAMTWSVFSIGYLGLGDVATGLEYFFKGFVHNSFPPFYAWSEVAGGGGCPNFLTGAGGFLQSVVCGLGSIRLSTDTGSLIITPRLITMPSSFGEGGEGERLSLKNLHFHGARITIEFLSDVIIISLESPPKVGEGRVVVDGHALSVGLPAFISIATAPELVEISLVSY